MKISRPILSTSIALLFTLTPFSPWALGADGLASDAKFPTIKVDATPLPAVAGRISSFAP